LYNIHIEFGVPMKLVRLIKMCLNETYSKVCIGKYLSESFPIQNGLWEYAYMMILRGLLHPVQPDSYCPSRSLKSKSKSKSHCDRWSVSRYVLVSRPNLGHLTRVFFSRLLSCLFGAPSLTRGRACHVSVFVIEVYHSLVYLQQYLH
jgi:hypothetical protein